MNLNPETIQFLEQIVKTARMVGIEDVIIEPTTIRGMDEDRTIVLYHTANIPTLPFDAIGLSRIGTFQSRLDIVKGQEKFAVDVTTHETEGYVKSMVLSAKGVKVDFRCANPKTIQAPKNISDTMATLVSLDSDSVVLLSKAIAAMKAETVTIISNDDGVTFELYDVNSDKFTHTFKSSIEPLGSNDDTKFVFSYPTKIVLPLFKENSDSNFAIGEKGLMNIDMGGFDLYILPQVG
jgi:hypothetical protein